MKEIKVFSRKLILLMLGIIATDVVLGLFIHIIFDKQKSGKYFITTYALNKANQDILIFGNSHAAEHFNTPLMAEKMKLSVFNFGVQGENMLYYYPVIESMLSYHKPKLIILNLDYNELNFNSDDYQRMAIFLPYFHQNKFIDSAIFLMGQKQKYLALSSLYRYNSTVGYILLNSSNKAYNKSYKSLGFDPQYGNTCQSNATTDKENEGNKKQNVKFDELKTRYLLTLIKDIRAAKIPLVITTTPLFTGMGENVHRQKLEQLLKATGVKYWDYINNENFKGKCNLFTDKSHLNKEGADLFTNSIIRQITESKFITSTKAN